VRANLFSAGKTPIDPQRLDLIGPEDLSKLKQSKISMLGLYNLPLADYFTSLNLII
jgi:hypothetical protein